jgi:hypothetical protein
MSDRVTASSLRAGVLGFVGLLVLTSVSYADLWVQGYSANLHNRFYVGADRTFIGQGYDWSGVGQNGTWATMVSPTYFVSANHYHPAGGSTLTFYEGNTTNHPHAYTVDSTFAANSGDLFLGRLTSPIPASDHVGYYPILKLSSDSQYAGQEIFVYGVPNRVGRNRITAVFGTKEMEYEYNTYGNPATVGADEAYLASGDSGAPSFTVYGSALTLLGTHQSHTGTPPPLDGWWSIDNFVPDYIAWLNSKMVGEQVTVVLPLPGDANLDGTVNGVDFNAVLSNYGRTGMDWRHGDFNGDGAVNGVDLNVVFANYNQGAGVTAAVPEPSTLGMLALGAMGVLAWRGWRKRK